MKKSVIKDIFHGVKGHIETMDMPKSNQKTPDTAFNELKERLSPELFKLHEEFADALEDNWAEEVDFYFVEGFKLGLLIGIECMED